MTATESLTYQQKYTLTSEELDKLTRELIHSYPPKTTDRFICYLLRGTDEVSNLGRHVEKEVFAEMVGSTDGTMSEFYEVYEHASMFFVVLDAVFCRPAGVLRAVKNSSAGLPTLNDAPEHIGITVDMFKEYHKVEKLDSVWDFATIAVRNDYRRVEGNLISNMLFRAMDVRAAYEGIEHYVSIFDTHIRTVFSPLGWAGEPIAGSSPVDYEGSYDSLFLYFHRPTTTSRVAESVDKVDRQLRSTAEVFKRRFIDGEGVDHRLMFQFSKNVPYDSTRKRFAKL
ncbi:hypothetical protein DL96DRAFT_1559302 [Flagelloscypha sp. PMI_526]|nr:hypothetical protein DL96DRAFT_1559302 [Flagelloscypha sp. PMI_526]